MDWSHILAFSATAMIVAITPGPNFLLIIKTVPSFGKKCGFSNIAGFASAFMLHGTLSIFCFSLILEHLHALYFSITLIGAAYLCFLGAQALREVQLRIQNQSAAASGIAIGIDLDLGDPRLAESSRCSQSLLKSWREGFVTNCLNPKISLFYLSVFPQFVITGKNSVSSSFLLVIIHITLHAIWFSSLILLIKQLMTQMSGEYYVNGLKTFSGMALIGLGITFAISASAALP